jgi:ABC-type glycerol-3-phosphate transport system permease component
MRSFITLLCVLGMSLADVTVHKSLRVDVPLAHQEPKPLPAGITIPAPKSFLTDGYMSAFFNDGFTKTFWISMGITAGALVLLVIYCVRTGRSTGR